jgi:hypothetical protein
MGATVDSRAYTDPEVAHVGMCEKEDEPRWAAMTMTMTRLEPNGVRFAGVGIESMADSSYRRRECKSA